jgi:peptidoglycan-associated lipoprotein
MQDVFFDYDRHHIRTDGHETLRRNGEALRNLFGQYPNVRVTIEGHADERGSAEYNLGARRSAGVVRERLPGRSGYTS